MPSGAELPERIPAVLAVVYLLFNEGYAASSGTSRTRSELSTEAIRLGRLLLDLLPEPEVIGLAALILLHESRRPARVSADGELVLLEQQDRSTWNQAFIGEGIALVERALSTRRFGPYTLQAAAAVHAEARTPVVELNRAAAVAMHEGPAAGLVPVEALFTRGELRDFHLAHSARADLFGRLWRRDEARPAYGQARALAKSDAEILYMENDSMNSAERYFLPRVENRPRGSTN